MQNAKKNFFTDQNALIHLSKSNKKKIKIKNTNTKLNKKKCAKISVAFCSDAWSTSVYLHAAPLHVQQLVPSACPSSNPCYCILIWKIFTLCPYKFCPFQYAKINNMQTKYDNWTWRRDINHSTPVEILSENRPFLRSYKKNKNFYKKKEATKACLLQSMRVK